MRRRHFGKGSPLDSCLPVVCELFAQFDKTVAVLAQLATLLSGLGEQLICFGLLMAVEQPRRSASEQPAQGVQMTVRDEPACFVVLKRPKTHSKLGGERPLREVSVLSCSGEALPGQPVRFHRKDSTPGLVRVRNSFHLAHTGGAGVAWAGWVARHRRSAAEGEDAMELLSRYLLRAIEAHESENACWPTVPELAEDLGVPPEFGHHHLIKRIKRQIMLGRLSQDGGRVQLTQAGRAALARDAPTHGSSALRLSEQPATRR
jgi:hypothetical protein